jgi:hypothetical protein
MIGVKESGWLEFDVYNAVQMWQHHKNLRLVVELENEEKLSLDAKQYFDINFCPSKASQQIHNTSSNYIFFSTGSNSNATLPLVHIPLLEICLLESSQTQEERDIDEVLLSLKSSNRQNEDIPLTPTNNAFTI